MLRIAKGTNEDVDVDAASREHEVGATEVDSADPASHMEQASGAVAAMIAARSPMVIPSEDEQTHPEEEPAPTLDEQCKEVMQGLHELTSSLRC